MNQMKSKAICLETTVRKVDPNFLFPIGLCIFLILQTGCSALRETPPTPALEMALPTVRAIKTLPFMLGIRSLSKPLFPIRMSSGRERMY